MIDLEHRRRIRFGRAPDGRSPGELPAAVKWSAVSDGIELLRSGDDWALIDVRWDDPQTQRRAEERAEESEGE